MVKIGVYTGFIFSFWLCGTVIYLIRAGFNWPILWSVYLESAAAALIISGIGFGLKKILS